MHRIIVFVLLAASAVEAQSVSTRMGARASGMGYSSFTLIDELSFFNNVASLAWCTSPSLAFAYDLTQALPGANRAATAFALPTGIGFFGLGAFRFGDDVYSEQLLSGAFSHRLASASLGIKANWIQYRSVGFESRSTLSIDFSGLMKVTPAWTVAGGIFNVNQASIVDGEVLPVVFVAGLGWQADGGPLLAMEMEKQLKAAARMKFGVEIPIQKKLRLRAGFGTAPVSLHGGVGALLQRMALDFSTSYGEALGFSYQASAALRFRKATSP